MMPKVSKDMDDYKARRLAADDVIKELQRDGFLCLRQRLEKEESGNIRKYSAHWQNVVERIIRPSDADYEPASRAVSIVNCTKRWSRGLGSEGYATFVIFYVDSSGGVADHLVNELRVH